MDNFDILIVPLIVGILEVVKKFDIDKKFIPLASILIGVVFSFLKNGFSTDTILVGIGYGLSACGLYSGTKNAIEK
ncbi:phage holin family protein [Citroniella saccharovorans]|uniref:Phage holin family protein n=1 Tax=Citroniella saccharovorans TaxID=2053367 RepID=A0AAW9N0G1_9FIRM|nr:phage holin family protein [Citroniella saccharovorans]MEB3428884.1 phage holin family protein [Citroniella saccharovorans]MEB3430229.1 phage holin family protein [Citroniella saccharovorans]